MKILDILKSMKNSDYIWEDHYPEETEINLKEGLIKSTDIGQTVGILKKQFITWSFQYDKEKPDFQLHIYKDINWDKFKTLLVLANNLGYFPSYYITNDGTNVEKGKYDESKLNKEFNNPKIEDIIISFEAKYDTSIDMVQGKIPSFLYHVTPKANADKILKVGLLPKSRSKKAFHPERVYLMKNINDAEKLAKNLSSAAGSEVREWVLLEIDVDYLLHRHFRLYKDPNFKEKGYYTMNNIPPQAIEKIKDIEL